MRVKVASVGLGRTEVVFGVGGVEGVATTFFLGGGGQWRSIAQIMCVRSLKYPDCNFK